MKNRCRAWRAAAWIALAAVVSLLTGCVVEGEREQVQEGRRLIEAYLSAQEGASVSEIYADVQRPDADKLALSDYVKGTFRRGGEEYAFAVDVVTGEIWTSEQLPTFYDACADTIAQRLGLGDCAAELKLWVDVPAWHTENSEWPWETAYLGEVLPVTVTDMDAYAALALEEENIRIDADIACRMPLSEKRADTAGWKNFNIRLYDVGDGELSVPDRETFSGDMLWLTETESRFTPAK